MNTLYIQASQESKVAARSLAWTCLCPNREIQYNSKPLKEPAPLLLPFSSSKQNGPAFAHIEFIESLFVHVYWKSYSTYSDR